MNKTWKEHRERCMNRRANKVALEYAREENRGLWFGQAAMHDDVKKMKKLTDGLTHAAAVAKFTPKMAGMAMKVFVDFEDKRQVGSAAYGAAQEGSNRALRMLAELNADLNLPSTGEVGGRPAHISAQCGRTSTIELLVTLRADIWLGRRIDDASPLHAACQNNKSEAASLLISLKANVDRQDNEGRTACWSSSFRGHKRMIKLLVDAKASVNLADQEGKTPVYLASERGHPDTIMALVCRWLRKYTIPDSNDVSLSPLQGCCSSVHRHRDNV